MCRCLPVVALSLSLPLTAQEGSAPGRYEVLARRALDGPEREAAQSELRDAVQTDYPEVHAAWQSGSDPRLKTFLRHVLSLPQVEEAEVVLRGRITKIETIQGGVIDYHHVLVWFEDLEIVKTPDEEREQLTISGTFAVARGTHHDSWLCAVIRRDLERVQGVRTWAFHTRELQTEAGGRKNSLRIHEYTLLPADAFDVLKGK